MRRYGIAIVFVGLWLAQQCPAATNLVFQTGFEASEGYAAGQPLSHQFDWRTEGTGGNGVMPGTNQHAFLGISPPTSPGEGYEILWKPLGLDAIPTNALVKFSVDMTITASSGTAGHDYFGWSIINRSGVELFELGFDNESMKIYTVSDDDCRAETGVSFVNGSTNGKPCHLEITIDFTQNGWNATFDGNDLHINKTIATFGEALDLGDIDAFWGYRDPYAPGNNCMVFDNYRVIIESRPWVQTISATNRQVTLRVYGDDGLRYAVEATSKLPPVQWTPLITNTAVSGFFDFVDLVSSRSRFYRTRWVP